MTSLDSLVDEVTARESGGVLGVVLAASNETGKEDMRLIASHFSAKGTQESFKVSGFKRIEDEAPPLQASSVFRLSSATKLTTSVAALKCVERGQVTVNESVYDDLPELEKLKIVSFNEGGSKDAHLFRYTTPKNEITLPQLLTHTSGVGYDVLDPRLQAWRKSRGEAPMTTTRRVLEAFSAPLIFEPGEGWMYAVTRTPEGFAPAATVYEDNPPEEDGGGGLCASVPDYMAVLTDLVQDSPKLLKRETAELLFLPQLTKDSSVSKDFQNCSFIYDTILGVLTKGVKAGATGVFWFANREKGLAAMYASQLYPPMDSKGSALQQAFLKGVWRLFGEQNADLE